MGGSFWELNTATLVNHCTLYTLQFEERKKEPTSTQQLQIPTLLINKQLEGAMHEASIINIHHTKPIAAILAPADEGKGQIFFYFLLFFLLK